MKTKETTRGFAILSIATLLVKMLSIIYVPLLIRAIGDEGYGIYYAAYTVFVFIYIVTTTGIPTAISKQVSELISVNNYKDAVKSFKIARIIMIIVGSVMTILMFIFSKNLASYVEYKEANFAIMALAPTVLFSAVRSAYMGYFQGQDNMTPRAVSQVIEQVVNVIFSLLFAYLWYNKGLEMACMGATIGTPLGAFVTLVYFKIYYNKHKKITVPKNPDIKIVRRYSNKQLAKRIINYTIPITTCWGLQYLGNFYETKILKLRLLLSGFSDSQSNILYGYLGKYTTLINVPVTIISSLSAAILPLISRASALDNRNDIKQGVDYSFKTTFLISLPSAVGLMVLSKPIYVMFGRRFTAGYQLMTYGALALVLTSIVQIQTTILQSVGRLYKTTFNMIIGIIVRLSLDFALVSYTNINIYGAIIASYIGYLVTVILNDVSIKMWTNIKFNLAEYIYKPLLASIFMGFCSLFSYYYLNKLFLLEIGVYISNLLAAVIAVAVGILSYGYFMVITGGIKKEDLSNLPNKMVKLIPGFVIARMK